MIVNSDSWTVSVGTTSVNLLAPDQNRDGCVIHNQAGVLYLKLSKNATPTNFTYRLIPKAVLELPGYAGWVSAIRETGTEDVMISTLY